MFLLEFTLRTARLSQMNTALTFDYTSQNARERELPLKFLLSRDADRFNNQDVFLKLRERIGKTSHFEDYTSHRFQLRRGISTDFDF